MSSPHDDVDEFWGGQRDWTDSQPRQRATSRTPLGQRLKTGMQSVFDAGATGSRLHGDTGPTPVAEPVSSVPGDLDFDLTAEPGTARRTSDGLSIGELAQPYEANVHEATRPVPRVNVGVVTPPSNRSIDVGEPHAIADPDPGVDNDYSGLAVETDSWDEEWDSAGPVGTARGGVDPLLAKFGVLAVVLTLLAGFFISTRGDGSDDSISSTETATTLAVATPTADESTGSKKQASGGADRANDASAGAATAANVSADESEQVAERAVPVETQAPEVECGADYEVVEGDYWLRLADGSGASLNELLTANGASTATPLYPGSTICLPEGAATPPPPPAPSAAAPAQESETASASGGSNSSDGSSSNSGSSSKNGSSGSKSKKPAATTPATTAPPNTQAPSAPAPPASASEVERLIRKIFPADQHEKALAVAWRESNHRPDVYNGWCCYGVFQIYYSVHDGWLPQFGVHQASDLYDARKNIQAAYHLYQQAGGWGPWGG